MPRPFFLLLMLLLSLASASCTKEKVIPTQLVAMEKKLSVMREKAVDINRKLDDKDLDSGTQIELTNKRMLLESRMKRMQKRIEIFKKNRGY